MDTSGHFGRHLDQIGLMLVTRRRFSQNLNDLGWGRHSSSSCFRCCWDRISQHAFRSVQSLSTR